MTGMTKKTKNMKIKLIIFTVIILFSISLQAQESNEHKRKGKIGITFSSFGESDVFRIAGLDGEASYLGDNYYALGISYVRSISHWLELETGLEYSRHTIIITPAFNPNIDISSRETKLSIISTPLMLRANFLKFFFINGGLFLDIDTSISSSVDSQTGIGTMFGIATKYDFNFGASIFLNPYVKFHSLGSFSMGGNQQKLLESGVRIGFAF